MFLSKANHKESEIPTSSLADIVFLLLIFFLVTTSIDTGKALNLLLPKNDEKVVTDPARMFSIMINDMNQVAVEGNPVTIPELRNDLKQQLLERPDIIVSLKADQNSSYKLYIDVLDNIKEAYGSQTPRISIIPLDNN